MNPTLLLFASQICAAANAFLSLPFSPSESEVDVHEPRLVEMYDNFTMQLARSPVVRGLESDVCGLRILFSHFLTYVAQEDGFLRAWRFPRVEIGRYKVQDSETQRASAKLTGRLGVMQAIQAGLIIRSGYASGTTSSIYTGLKSNFEGSCFSVTMF